MTELRRSKRGAGNSASKESTKNNESLFEGIVFAFDRQTMSPSDSTLVVISDEGGTVLTRRPSKATIVHFYLTHDLEIDPLRTQELYGKKAVKVNPSFIDACISAGRVLDPTEIASTLPDQKPIPKSKKAAASSRASKKLKVEQPPGKENLKEEGSSQPVDSKVVDQPKGEEEERQMVTALKKGAAIVDPKCPIADRVHVYSQGNDVYDCMLNQTNIANNNNKFYIIQLLEDDSGKAFYVWTRWGRVGLDGQNSLNNFSALAMAMDWFCQKFNDKTKNIWQERHQFVQRPQKYFLVERDFGEDEPPLEVKPTTSAPPVPDSLLSNPLQDLIKMIFNLEMMEQQMMEVGYDAKKMPLGRLSKSQIQKGYEVLRQISEELQKPRPAANTLMNLSSLFYTIIPHVFGMRRPPTISSKPMLKSKLEMVESLAEIEIATKLIREMEAELTENPVDLKYQSLGCTLSAMEHKSSDFQLISTYVKNTHGRTHNAYDLELLDVFEMNRPTEHEAFTKSAESIQNRMLLWHGSRVSNFVGILSQGLRIAPPEAPATGYMFGKGIYFADMISKSANYCCASTHFPVGLVVLAEVAIGTPLELPASDYNAGKRAKTEGFHSTKGVGKTAPNPSEFVKTEDGVLVPCGKPMDHKIESELLYNEYIVYDPSQVRQRYLCQVRFHFK